MKKVLIIAIALFHSFSADAVENNIQQPRILRIVFGTNIASLNPMKQLDLISASVLSNIYDGLLYSKGISFETEAMLAESTEIIDKKTQRYHLRKGVNFHNGETFNAKSVC